MELWQSAVEMVRGAPPAMLFIAIAFLPLAGVPATPFVLAAGARLGVVPGCLLVALALVVNVTLGYWLARNVVRGLVLAWLHRRGYRVPSVSEADEAELIVLIRVAPGMPLALQNYLLGLAGVGFWRYLLFSLPINWAMSFSVVWIGDSLAATHLSRVIFAACSFIALGLAARLAWRHFRRRQGCPAQAKV